tara:strand:- start:2550 stop:2969 length:420 start_codon:yes stop_codon:yes gene_type:complete
MTNSRYYVHPKIIDLYVNPNNICIFSKTTCSFCEKAKKLLESYSSVKATIYEIDNLSEGKLLHKELIKHTNFNTVPNIFILGTHVGGFNELLELEKNGTLNDLFSKFTYRCEFCNKSLPTKEYSCGCYPRGFSDWGNRI